MIRRWDKSKPPTGPFALNRDCPQAQGLVAWYPMGGGRNYVPDLAGKSHMGAGVAAGSATILADGRPALTFDGSSQYLVSNTTATQPTSMAAWFVQTSDATGQIANISSSTNNYQRASLLTLNAANSSYVRAQIQDGSGNAVFAVTSNTWTVGRLHHGVAVFGSDTSRAVYLDGGLPGTNATSRTISTDRFYIGVGNNGSTAGAGVLGSFFPGHIGETAFYNVAITADIVRSLYSPGTRFELWYPLRSRKWIVGAAATAPNITALSAINITATSAQPRISYS